MVPSILPSVHLSNSEEDIYRQYAKQMEIPSVPSEKGRSTVIFYNHFYCHYSITKCMLLEMASQGAEEASAFPTQKIHLLQ